MPKRKRESHEGHGLVTDPMERRKKFITQVIEKQEKQISRALKVGKGFERQRLAKRTKIATEKGDEDLVRRLNSEVEALKALELPSLASHHLHKSLLKAKSVATSPAFPLSQRDIPPVSHDAATLNVAARLYSSNPVKTATTHAIEEVKRAVGVGGSKIPESTEHSHPTVPTSSSQRAVDDDQDMHFSDMYDSNSSRGHSLARSESAPPAFATSSENSDHSMNESTHEESAAFDHRIASASDSSDTDDDSPEDLPKRGASQADKLLADLSTSPPPTHPQANSKASRKLKTNQSAFLPSLTVGGYISGSDSGADDDLDVASMRKNRRGQRARQQIWEKRYGSKAKHLQKQRQDHQQSDRNQGWDLRKGAVGEQGGRSAKGRKERGRAGETLTDANAIQISGSKLDLNHRKGHQSKEENDRPLHPSWEAKKKAKEQQKQAAVFQGKKITFD